MSICRVSPSRSERASLPRPHSKTCTRSWRLIYLGSRHRNMGESIITAIRCVLHERHHHSELIGSFWRIVSDLTSWAQQGVLMLNTALTVRAHEVRSRPILAIEIFVNKSFYSGGITFQKRLGPAHQCSAQDHPRASELDRRRRRSERRCFSRLGCACWKALY